MKCVTTLFFLIYFNFETSLAQDRLITCSSENNPDNSVSIFADSRCYGEYTLKVSFNTLMGYTSNARLDMGIALVTVTNGRREIIRLTPEKSAISRSFQYRYQYFPGIALRKAPDTSFVYLIPSNAGKHIRISKVSSLVEKLGQEKKADFYATGFVYKKGDTICAARAGVIYDCNDKVKEGEDASAFYKSNRNKIAVEHKDGSLCNYEMLAPIHLLVSPGDYVYPGQPLAVFNKESEKYILLFSTYYLDETKFLEDRTYGNSSPPLYLIYTPAHFYIGENDRPSLLQLNTEYQVKHPVTIISAEMSKREKKKRGY